MIEIPLTRGKYTIIDDADADLADIKWYANDGKGEFYAARCIRLRPCIRKTVRMHRVILERKLKRELRAGEVVDHIDGSGLNNSRDNIRLATYTENSANARKSSGVTTSRYRGVSWHKATGKWQACIRDHHKYTYIGLFDSEETAARVYDKHAIRIFGEFAKLNFQGDEEMER